MLMKPYDPTPAVPSVTSSEQTQQLMRKIKHLEQQKRLVEDQVYNIKRKLQEAKDLNVILEGKKNKQKSGIEQQILKFGEGYVTSVPENTAEMREHLRQMVALVITQERVLDRLKWFGECEEAWKSEDSQKAEKLELEVMGVVSEYVNNYNKWSSYTQKLNDEEQQLQAIRGQKHLLDEKMRELRENRSNLKQKVDFWESKAKELGRRLDAINTIEKIKSELKQLLDPINWDDIPWEKKTVTIMEFRKPFESNSDAQEDISEFMRDISVSDDQFVYTTEKKRLRIEKRGPIYTGRTRSAFSLHNGTKECIGKIFHLRCGPMKDNDCATRIVKSGLLGNEVARAYTKVLQNALDNQGEDEKWIFEYITTSLIFNYGDPYESSSQAPEGTFKKTVMMIESSLNTDDLKFTEFIGPSGEIKPLDPHEDSIDPSEEVRHGDAILVADTLSHWSYIASDRKFMVVDIKGTYNSATHTFLLTNPGIYTEHDDFWNALNHDYDRNFRHGGIETYKKNHNCNKYCKLLDIDYW